MQNSFKNVPYSQDDAMLRYEMIQAEWSRLRETFPSLALFTPENAQDWIDQAQNHFEGTQYACR